MELVYTSMSLTEDFIESCMVSLFIWGYNGKQNIQCFSMTLQLLNPNFSLEYTHSQELDVILVHM